MEDNKEETFSYSNRKMLILLSIPLLLLAAWGWWIFSLHLCLNRFEREIRSAGEPFTIEELDKYYTSVPDDENAANLYLEAGRNYVDTKDYKLVLIAGSAELFPGDKIPPDILAATREFLNDNEATIALIEKATEKGKCRFPINLKNGFKIEFRHLQWLPGAAQRLAVKSLIQAEDGNCGRALETSAKIFSVGRSLENEPVLISCLIAWGFESIALSNFETLLSSYDFTGEELLHFENRIPMGDDVQLMGALIGERAKIVNISDKDFMPTL